MTLVGVAGHQPSNWANKSEVNVDIWFEIHDYSELKLVVALVTAISALTTSSLVVFWIAQQAALSTTWKDYQLEVAHFLLSSDARKYSSLFSFCNDVEVCCASCVLEAHCWTWEKLNCESCASSFVEIFSKLPRKWAKDSQMCKRRRSSLACLTKLLKLRTNLIIGSEIFRP